MKSNQHERIIVTGVMSVLLFAWLGFLVHRAPRFAGSGIGSAIGIAGALLMLVPLAYPIVKRIPFFKSWITPHISMRSLLTAHVYSGILGPLLGIIHAGHKFDSWLGITLTATMLLVVVSGFVGRYLLSFVGPAGEVTRLAESVADLEYAIRTHELFNRWCSRWLMLHLVLSVILYLLLGLHVWAGVHFGLRWFS
jgi:hypothetical protein